jgi:molybdopterin converting factor small subunit
MELVVRLFGPEAELTGVSQVTVRVDGPLTCRELREAITRDVPSLAARMSTCRLAVNHEFVDDAFLVSEQDEVALIGLVSGG